MATPEIQTTEAAALVVVRQSAQLEQVFQAHPLAVYNIPADEVHSTGVAVQVTYRRVAQELEVTQQAMLAVVRGRTSNPRLVAWGFTLDGHDFYVLKLGTGGKTLVYDLTTKQWSWWNSGRTSPSLRAFVGMNWSSAGSVPQRLGSNVVVGDDTLGVIWVMDPLHPTDEAAEAGRDQVFTRVATAQLPVRGRQGVPVFSVFLTASLGDPSPLASPVVLSYSDDQGNSYVQADIPQPVISGDYAQSLAWRSMGMASAPGRLFRIQDDGALPRIDSLDINPED